jgi:hypothetical protein
MVAPASRFAFVSDLAWTSMTNGWGPLERDRSNGETGATDGRPLTLAGVVYAKGLGVHAPSDVRYPLPEGCTVFTAVIGIDDEVAHGGSVVFKVLVDGAQRFDSGVMTAAAPSKRVHVDVTGAAELQLLVTTSDDGDVADHSDWANAQVLCRSGARSLFQTPTAYPGTTNAHGVIARDVNRDGRPDLIVADAGSHQITVFIGTGNGSFAAGGTYPVGLVPKHVEAADFNLDTVTDLVTADQNDSTVTVLLGRGDGTFVAGVSYPVCSRAHETSAADFNGDGVPDLAVACWGGAQISVLIGRGDGTFGPPVPYGVAFNPVSLAPGDFNGDGRPDLAVSCAGGSNVVSVLINNGDGTLGAAVSYPNGPDPHGIRAADLNRDGRLDLVNANAAGAHVSVMLGDGTGAFHAPVQYQTGVAPTGIALADITGDTIVDIVTANTGGNYPTCCYPGGNTFAVLAGKGDGTFVAPELYQTGTTPFAVTVADFDGDDRPDIAIANWDSNDVTVHLHAF